MSEPTFTVSELLATIDQAIAADIPRPIWVRGEITGLRRTTRGAAFFRLVDASVDNSALDVAARGRVMFDIDRELSSAGLGTLRNGVEVRLQGTVGLDHRQSLVRLNLLRMDPAFTAGRLAMERAEVLRRLASDGSLQANHGLELPLVPLQVGLVTSRGSAAHADFIDHLSASGLRFSVKTAHTSVQGEQAAEAIARAIQRVGVEPIDMIALIRGGGSKLDLSVFDAEVVGRAIAAAPVPVVTGIGHEVDRTVADEAAAIYQKTPTAASEWLVSRVAEFAERVRNARIHIRREAESVVERSNDRLRAVAATLSGVRGALTRQRDHIDYLRKGIEDSARAALAARHHQIEALAEWFSSIGVDQTLRRGFALVTTADGDSVVRSIDQVQPGDTLWLRFADGTVPVTVEES